MRDGYLRGALSPRATQRQMDVLAAFVAAGGSVQDAADLVGIRPSTVKRHLADLRARSGLTTEQLHQLARVPRDALRSRVRAGGRSAVLHLRTREPNEHEVDLVVERGDGRVLAIEVKLARTVEPHDLRHLRWLRERIGDDLIDAVVVATGTQAYRQADGIAVVLAALLGP